jgi:hypothetical protein
MLRNLKNFPLLLGAWLIVSMGAIAAPAQSTQSQISEAQHPGVSVDLTGVVVTALTLGFGYGVLKTFQGGSK